MNTIMTNIENNFYNANEAFEYFYKTISKYGTDFANTKACLLYTSPSPRD